MSYAAVRDTLRTGDLVFFSGKGNISAGIKWALKSKWSHVGMVLLLNEYDMVLLWESTTLTSIPDLEFNEPRKGVQLVSLSERLRGYNGEVGIRKLNGELSDSQIRDLMNFRHDIKGKPYEQSQLELIKSAYDGPLGQNSTDLSSIFCSEMVAEALLRMGVLVPGQPSNEYTPKDLSSEGDMELVAPWSYGEEMMLKV